MVTKKNKYYEDNLDFPCIKCKILWNILIIFYNIVYKSIYLLVNLVTKI